MIHLAHTDIGSITVDLHSQHESAVQSSSGETEHLELPDNLTGDVCLQSITTSGFQPSSGSKMDNLEIPADIMMMCFHRVMTTQTTILLE